MTRENCIASSRQYGAVGRKISGSPFRSPVAAPATSSELQRLAWQHLQPSPTEGHLAAVPWLACPCGDNRTSSCQDRSARLRGAFGGCDRGEREPSVHLAEIPRERFACAPPELVSLRFFLIIWTDSGLNHLFKICVKFLSLWRTRAVIYWIIK